MSLWERHELRIVLAFALGMLIGTERERRRAEPAYSAFAGLRTFGLVGLLGGLLAHLGGSALVAVGAGCVALLAVTAYVINRDAADRGVTTEIAKFGLWTTLGIAIVLSSAWLAALA